MNNTPDQRLQAALAYPEPIIQYGFRLRDTTLLEFDSKAARDARMADFVAAEWQVTPLTRPMLPAQYGEWAEETEGAQTVADGTPAVGVR